MSEVKETQFKGLPLCAIYRDAEDRYPFQFGVRKAGLILKHVTEIKDFYARHSDAE